VFVAARLVTSRAFSGVSIRRQPCKNCPRI